MHRKKKQNFYFDVASCSGGSDIRVLLCCNIAFAEDNETQSVVFDEVSSLDTDIITGRDLTIRDYPEQLHATEAAVRSRVRDENNPANFELYGLEKDDPIVDIVSKDYFFAVGQELKMGDEYGYFINTTQSDNGNYLSTVLVFDITTNTDLSLTTDRVIVEVSPIFQYKYAGLTSNSSSEKFNNVELSYDVLNEPCVVAYPSKMTVNLLSSTVEYEVTEEYYLKDVSFGASLYNEQALNRGDSGYDPYNDYGSYFTGFDYSYNGKYREYGEFGFEDTAWMVADTVMWALDMTGLFPKLGKVYSIVSLTKGWIEYKSLKDSATIGEVKTAEKKITATCYYQNRDDQLKYYKDNNNNPFLVKAAIMAIGTDSEKSMWYGVGDNVTAYFNIGHSALNGKTPNYTRFTDQLAVQIVSSDGDRVVTAGDTIIQDTLREPETKELSYLSTGDIYMLPGGQDHLVYKDMMYESDYEVRFDLSDNANVTVDGVSKYGKNLSFSVHANQYSDIAIDLDGENVGIKGKVNIFLNDSTSIGSIAPNGNYILKTTLGGIKTLRTGNANLTIEKILTYDNNKFSSYESYVAFEPGSSVTYPFENGVEYYIVIHKGSSKTVGGVDLQVSDIQGFVPEQDIILPSDIQAFSFVNTYETEMSFQLILPQQGNVDKLTVFNSNGQAISYATVMESENIKYSFGLQAGEKCYMFCSLNTPASFIVLPDETYIKWEIDGVVDYVNYKIGLPRGASYSIRLLYCKDSFVHEVLTSYNIDDREDWFTFKNNVLTLDQDVPYEYVVTLVPIKYPNATLRVEPTKGRKDIDYTITFDKAGGKGGSDSVVANYDRNMPDSTTPAMSISAPTRTGYIFKGYYSIANGNGKQYYDSHMVCKAKWDNETDATLYAYWEGKKYTVTFYQNSGEGGTTSVVATYGEPMPLVTLPKRTGYNFLGYYTSTPDQTCYYQFFDPNLLSENHYYLYYAYTCDFLSDISLHAKWESMSWSVGVWADFDNKGKTTIPGESFDLSRDQEKTYYIPGIKDYDFVSWKLTYRVGTIKSGTTDTINMKNLCVGNYRDYTLTISYKYNPQPEACVTAGTLVTLADGSLVPVEKLTGNEMLLVWNMQTGQVETAPILFIDSEPLKIFNVINLTFSDGTKVNVVSSHGFWDFDLNRYVYLDENAEQYVGHWFNKLTTDVENNNVQTRVQLVDVTITQEYTTAYSPVTYGHLCYYVNGMLSMPGGIAGLINIFDVDAETLTIDQSAFAEDVEKYGLFTYEEFSELYQVSEEIFEAFNGEYLKVSIGKGLITHEQIGKLIERYSKFF